MRRWYLVDTDKIKLLKIISGNINEYSINRHLDWIIETIPEIKPMINFEQNNPYHCYDLWRHTVHSVLNVQDTEILRITMLFHDIGKYYCYTCGENGIGHFYGHPNKSAKIARNILERLSFDESFISMVEVLIFNHDAQIPSKSIVVKRWLNKLGEETFRMLIEVKRADAKAQSEEYRTYKLDRLVKLELKLNEVVEHAKIFGKKDLAVNGRDLISMGFVEGGNIGVILNHLTSLVQNGEIENNKISLIDELKRSNKGV